MRGDIESKLDSMVKRNKSRTNYQEKFQRLIDEYNAGSMNVDVLFEKLIQFVTQELNVEDQRHMVEQLSEEELAIFDLLTQPDLSLSEKEKAEVKKVVRQLLETLNARNWCSTGVKSNRPRQRSRRQCGICSITLSPPVIRENFVNEHIQQCISTSTTRIMAWARAFMRTRVKVRYTRKKVCYANRSPFILSTRGRNH